MIGNEKLGELVLQILESESIDEKRRLGKQVVELFKIANNGIPIATLLNLSLWLRDIIDNFIIQDNLTSRQTLENFFSSTMQDLKVAS